MGQKKNTHTDNTSADAVQVAFDYQYYYFLWKLLSLRPGESVGLEVKDDIHTELNNNEQILFQLKHTTKVKANDRAINLTTLDTDLWKTLSNWSQIITDNNDGRSEEQQQLAFVRKTTFILATNKSSTKNNQLLKSVTNLQYGTTPIGELRTLLQTLKDRTQDSTIQTYIENTRSLTDPVFENFFLKIVFELDKDDILEKCKEAIKADKIPESKIDLVFSTLDSAIRKDNFITIKNGTKVQTSFDDFYSRYRCYYDVARNKQLTVKPFSGALPDDLMSQIFIQQLVEINDVEESDFEDVTRLTTSKLKLQNNINSWIEDGEITTPEVESLKEDAVNQWRNKHRSAFRGVKSAENENSIGVEILDSLREKKLYVSDQILDIDMSNGIFYDLSDVPAIGWRKDWEKYKK